jgi:hypothetical protein
MKTDTFQETFQRLSKPLILESQTRETLSNAPYRGVESLSLENGETRHTDFGKSHA